MMQKRPFNPSALSDYAVPWLTPNVSNWSAVRRYTIFVPVEQMFTDGTICEVATDDDISNIEFMLIEHFGGITRPPKSMGVGARDPNNPITTRETNTHEVFAVYAPNAAASDQYFQALRFELQDALIEGQVLISREELLLL